MDDSHVDNTTATLFRLAFEKVEEGKEGAQQALEALGALDDSGRSY
jgi:hypothetical protein